MTDAATLARTSVYRWDRDRLHAADAPQQAVRSFGIPLKTATAIINGERGRRP